MQTNKPETMLKTGPEDINMAECPPLPQEENISEEIWKQLFVIQKTLSKFTEKFGVAHCDLYNEGGVIETLNKASLLVDDIPQIQHSTYELREEVDLLKAIVIKQAEEINDLKRKTTDLTYRSMQNNLLIHNLVEKDTTDLEDYVIETIDQKLKIKIDKDSIDRIHRIGPKVKDRNRMIVIKFNRYKLVEHILSTAKPILKKGKNNLFFTTQSPTETLEARKHLFAIADQYKEKDPDTKYRITNGKLFVNNTLVKPALKAPTTTEVIQTTRDERRHLIQSTILVPSEIKTKKGNQFVAFATPTASLDEARAAYKALMLTPDILSATHAIGCTSLYNVYTAKKETHWDDDGEYGASRTILKVMEELGAKNMTVFVCRKYSGIHLGPDRWDIIKEVTKAALQAFEGKTKTPK